MFYIIGIICLVAIVSVFVTAVRRERNTRRRYEIAGTLLVERNPLRQQELVYELALLTEEYKKL